MATSVWDDLGQRVNVSRDRGRSVGEWDGSEGGELGCLQ
jgi:hypothetical protein